MDPHVVIRAVAGTAADLVNPNPLSRFQGDARPDGVTIGAGADQVQSHPVVRGANIVDEKTRLGIDVWDKNGKMAGVPQVADG